MVLNSCLNHDGLESGHSGSDPSRSSGPPSPLPESGRWAFIWQLRLALVSSCHPDRGKLAPYVHATRSNCGSEGAGDRPVPTKYAMRTILVLFVLFLGGCILAALLTPPHRAIYVGPCTQLPVVEAIVGGVSLSMPSAMRPDLAESTGQEKIHRDRELRHYCKEQTAFPLLVQYVSLQRYPNGKPFGPEMVAIRLADNPNRAAGEKALLGSGATFGPKFFGEPTIIIMGDSLKTVEGPTRLYRVVGRFYNAQATFDLVVRV